MSANITTFSKPVDTEIKDVREQLAPEQLTNITVSASGTTITYNGCYKIGKLVVIALRLERNSGTWSNQYLLSNLPLPKDALTGGTGCLAVANNKNASIIITRSQSSDSTIASMYISTDNVSSPLTLNATYITEN